MNYDLKMSNISFVIPAYNCAGTIEAAVLSIINGNLEEGDEIVIVNDGSTDETRSIVARMEDRFKFIAVIDHETNKGGAAARNTAVRNSKNKIIFCLDSDNLLVQGSIGKLKEYMVFSGADAAAFEGLHYFREGPQKITHRWLFKKGVQTLSDCLAGPRSPIASGNYMYTKDCWEKAGGYPEFSQALDAWGFGLRQIATGAKMVVLPGFYYLHRHGHESYWVRSSAEKNRISFQILEPFFHMIEDSDIEYIRRNKDTWFSNLSKRPINIKNGGRGIDGRLVSQPFIERMFMKLQNISSNKIIKC